MASKTPQVVNKARLNKEKLVRIDGKAPANLIGGRFSLFTLIRISIRSVIMIQLAFNYGYYQGACYSATLYPYLKKIFKNNRNRMRQVLLDNIEFFNTSMYTGAPIIIPLHLYLLQTAVPDSKIKTIKFSLMGPLAGMGDAMFNFGLQPLIAGIAAGLSINGSWSGFWFYLIVFNLLIMVVTMSLTIITYRSGENFASNITSVMGNLVRIASMVGITIIGALAITYTHVNLGLHTITLIVSGGTINIHNTSYQQIFDKILPLVLPALLVGFAYLMLTRHNWSIYKILVFILLFGITGSVFGVFV